MNSVYPACVYQCTDALWPQFGATEAFSASQLITVLSDMRAAAVTAVTAGASQPAGADERPLDAHQLSQAIAAVQALADCDVPAAGTATVYVPDEKGVLVAAQKCVFNDAPWVGGVMGASGEPPRLVHPKLSNHVAERVGVASLRRVLLAQSADVLSLGLAAGAAGSHAAEAFGQSEALTTRLRHIIQDYPEGPGAWVARIMWWLPM